MSQVEKAYLGSPPNDVFVVLRSNGKKVGRTTLKPRFDLRRHSPSGFAWGYGGSGPAQLALALIADAVDDETAVRYYHQLKFRLIARLPGDRPFELTTGDVYSAVREIELEEALAQCKLRARSAILRMPLPLSKDAADEIIALIRLHTGHPPHVVEQAFNSALQELQLQVHDDGYTLEDLNLGLDRTLEEDR